MQESVDWVNRVLREQITGIRVVRAFVREDHERERFAEANTQYTGTALAVGRLMALVFPIVMLIFNASTVAVLWFGSHRVENGQMQIGELTAFMTYLMQILMSVMMATFMSMMIPRATVSAGRIAEVLDTDSTVRPAGEPGRASRRRGRASSCATSSSPTPGRTSPVLQGVSLTAEPGQHDRHHRQHRCRQVDAAVADPAALRRHRRPGASRRRRRPRRRARGRLVAHRAGAAEALPVHRHRRDQPALRRRRRHRRRAVGGAADRPGRGLRPGHARRAGRPDRPGRHQRLRRPAPAARHRAGPGRASPRSSSSTTPSRPSTCPPTRGCASALRAGHPAYGRRSSSPNGCRRIIDADHIVVLDDGLRGRARARTTSCSRRARRTSRSSSPSAARGGGGMSEGVKTAEEKAAEARRGPGRTPSAARPAMADGDARREVAELRPVRQAPARPAAARARSPLMARAGPRRRQRGPDARSARRSSGAPPTSSSPAWSARQLPATVTKRAGRRGLRARGQDTFADMVAGMQHLVPGQGIDFARGRPGAAVRAGALRRGERCCRGRRAGSSPAR